MAIPLGKSHMLDDVLRKLYANGAPKILMALVILLALSENVVIFSEAYSFIEIFSGKGWASRVMRTSGFTTAQMDILLTVPEMKSSVQNYMDLLTDAGFLLALTCILNGKTDNFLCLVGMVCSSFVTINKGTNKRYPYDALGDHAVSSVSQGNQLATRCALLLYSIVAMGGCFLLEQPRSSMLSWHPRIREVFLALKQVWSASWWMAHYYSVFPKRHIAWGNSQTIGKLDLGVLCRAYQKKLASLGKRSAKTYRSGDGKKRFVGTVHLKTSGNYPPRFGRKLARLHSEFCATRVVHEVHPNIAKMSGQDLFHLMDWNDLWEDGDMPSVLAWIRGNTHLQLGSWRPLFPTEL
ncbi:unnamed protein product [Durusdinium trenchii]|uniref:Uncharacterized protein n=1 Tax=Durusdinium trenchii TaxID=1381693 RepID=A0ABP0J355_9DINO